MYIYRVKMIVVQRHLRSSTIVALDLYGNLFFVICMLL